jgi:hypothetical protein
MQADISDHGQRPRPSTPPRMPAAGSSNSNAAAPFCPPGDRPRPASKHFPRPLTENAAKVAAVEQVRCFTARPELTESDID